MAQITYLKRYLGGFLIVGLYPLALMITHSVCMYYTNQDIANKLLDPATNTVLINASYYSIIADMAMVSTFMGIIIALSIPTVIATGAVDKLFSALGRLYPSSVGNATSYQQTAMEAQISQGMAQSQGSNYGEMNIASQMMQAQSKMATKLGDWTQANDEKNAGKMSVLGALKEANMASAMSKGTDGKEGEYVASGAWSGYNNASSSISIGDTMINGHTWNDKDGTHFLSGQALASGSGAMMGANEIAGAIAGGESRIFNSSGSIGGKEGEGYSQGLINSSRIQQNQIIGLGKESTLTLDQMANIQTASASKFQDSIAQGQALKDTYGLGNNGSMIGDGYKADAQTMALEKAKNFQSNSKVLRDLFGKNLETRSQTLEANIEQKLQGDIGSAEGYRNAQEKAKEAGISKDISRISAEIATGSKYGGITKTLASELSSDRDLADDKANKAIEDFRQSGTKEVQDNLKAQILANGGRVTPEMIANATAQLKDNQTRTQNFGSEIREELSKHINSSQHQQGYINSIIDDLSTSGAMNLQGTSASISGGKAMGTIGENGFTQAGISGLRMQAHEQAGELLSYSTTFGNAKGIDNLARDIGLSGTQRSMLRNASSPEARSRLFNLMTQGKTLSGHFGDTSFRANIGDASISTSYSGSISSQIGFSGGIVGNMGYASSYMAYQAGGGEAVRNIAGAESGLNFVNSVTDNALSFTKGGIKINKVFKKIVGKNNNLDNGGGGSGKEGMTERRGRTQ